MVAADEEMADEEEAAMEDAADAAAAEAADGAAQAAAEEAEEPWETFPSLAWSQGQEPGCGTGIQRHASCPDGWVVQVSVPSSTGNICQHTLGKFESREDAGRARDVALAWRVVHGVCDATWQGTKVRAAV
ncbi:hypothetical protein ABPG75_000905 [Micractinium tetrahymenae]